MDVIVVANGTLPPLAPFARLFSEADLLIAADGGASSLIEAGIQPDLIVGDMDSVHPPILEQWTGPLERFPAEKDETDLELALLAARSRGATTVSILGALGGRADHALANVLLLADATFSGLPVVLLDAGTRITAIAEDVTERETALPAHIGDLITLLPLTSRARGITTSGLRYALRDETLTLGSPRGVSNVCISRPLTVRCATGALLLIHTWSDEKTIRG